MKPKSPHNSRKWQCSVHQITTLIFLLTVLLPYKSEEKVINQICKFRGIDKILFKLGLIQRSNYFRVRTCSFRFLFGFFSIASTGLVSKSYDTDRYYIAQTFAFQSLPKHSQLALLMNRTVNSLGQWREKSSNSCHWKFEKQEKVCPSMTWCVEQGITNSWFSNAHGLLNSWMQGRNGSIKMEQFNFKVNEVAPCVLVKCLEIGLVYTCVLKEL